ncbi:Phosphatidate cytidylyltransferase [Petrimonas mucosa]|jgi:phosphatidate cytidylyltransferase|uniref:Phosphatidate cytidylyltransferase n=3 Tax=Dysgonomonadaceae TaxID=2005520 RepID=A0A1G4G6Z8_9BACT|nr:Phosphatidate cytidylyltransferase [Petrimonas mucosa]SFU48703.1 phosphatidate cytidylyltransferase [Porphyromonadaceae bacterium KHP3R9]
MGILGGKYSFIAVFGLFLVIGLYEFYRMTEKNTSHAISKAINIASGFSIFLSAYLYLENICRIALPLSSIIYLLILFVSAIFINRKDILHAIIYSFFGQIYITLPLSILMLLSYQHQSLSNDYHFAFVLAIFIFIWVNDTAAFVVGSLLGKHKFIERISPRKTVEGFIGGILFSVLASFALSTFFTNYTLLFWIGFGIVSALFGSLGDLFESLIKRTYEVKDSGTLIPGHGGILDRIDSLLIAIPAVYIYLAVVFA